MNILTIKEYQQLAKRTCPDLGNKEKNLLHMRLGIITEVGEVLDIFKKNLAYNKPIDKVNLGEELADIAWYLVNEATFRNKELNEIISFSDTGVLYMEALMYLDVNLQDENYSFPEALGLLKYISEEHNLNFEECLYNNIEKLKVRYPDKFDTERALNRDLDAERKTLEGDTQNDNRN